MVLNWGFLGSGKTTLLNRILRDGGRRIAVIENEYAVEIGVENELVDARKGATRRGQFYSHFALRCAICCPMVNLYMNENE